MLCTPYDFYSDKRMYCAINKRMKIPLPPLFPGGSTKYICAMQAERFHKNRIKRLLGRMPINKLAFKNKVNLLNYTEKNLEIHL